MRARLAKLVPFASSLALLAALTACGPAAPVSPAAPVNHSYNGPLDTTAILYDTRWGSTELTYHFENGTPDMTAEEAAVQTAFRLWSRSSGVTFRQVDYPSAHIVISWQTGDHGDKPVFDGPDGTLAHAAGPGPLPRNGDIHFDEAETWSPDPVTAEGQKIDLVSVAAHEIGHAIGLGHSSSTDALMAEAYSGSHRYLSGEDLIRVRRQYPSLQYAAHVQDLGWMAVSNEGEVGGTTRQGRRLEGLRFISRVGGTIQCDAHVQDHGWVPGTIAPLPGPQWTQCGTEGLGKRIEAVRLRFTGRPPGSSIAYRCHLAHTGWTPWVTDGATCGTTGQARQMEAIQIEIRRW